jgi:hypothetical protein
MDSRLPEDFIGEQVSKTGDDALIHQRWFEPAASMAEPLIKLPAVNGERVRPLSSDDPGDRAVVLREPDALKLSHVVEAELTIGKLENHPVMRVAFGAIALPFEPTCHPEVKQDGWPIGWGDQPFASPIRPPELATLQHP